MRKVSESSVEEFTQYRRFFQLLDGSQGTGFAFDCDDCGVCVLRNEAAQKNYEMALSSPLYEDRGVMEYVITQREPAVWVCCETEFMLERFTNTCPDCRADYNGSGQLLAPRSQWGEETGEHLSDILNEDEWGDW